MNKTLREGVGFESAFSAKRLENKRATLAEIDSSLPGVDFVPRDFQEDPEGSQEEVISKSSWLKAFLRPIVHFGFHLTKPLFCPIAFRLRRYLTEGLRVDILHEIQAAREMLAQELHSTYSQLAHEIQSTSAAITQELQSTSAAITEELQHEIRSSLTVLMPHLNRIEQYSCATARRVAINCNSGEVLVRTEVGYILCAASDYIMLTCLIDTGELELGTRRLIQNFLKPEDVFVDVGANIGMHTLAAAKVLQGKGKIIAFEPFEPTKRLLEKSVWINGYSEIVDIYQMAVSNSSGSHVLYLGATSGHHSLFQLDFAQALAAEPVEVQLGKLDEVIDTNLKITLLKIDAEGAELDVIDGGMALIKNNPDIALIVEFGPSHLRRTGHSPVDWLNSFTKIGLDYRAINAYTGELEDWTLEQLQNIESINLFFARKNSNAWTRLAHENIK